MKRYVPLFEETGITLEMKNWFQKRTNYHILLVQKYIDKIIELNNNDQLSKKLNNTILQKEKINHDQSKFQEPELTPYVYISWMYKCKDDGKEFILNSNQNQFMNNATNHHIKNNGHHPEYFDSSFISVPLKDRDSADVNYTVTAYKMTASYIAVMVADWMAMSEEKGTNPFDWADKNINIRWKFHSNQRNFIYELLDKCWNKQV